MGDLRIPSGRSSRSSRRRRASAVVEPGRRSDLLADLLYGVVDVALELVRRPLKSTSSVQPTTSTACYTERVAGEVSTVLRLQR
jgi:hypothetical protein